MNESRNRNKNSKKIKKVNISGPLGIKYLKLFLSMMLVSSLTLVPINGVEKVASSDISIYIGDEEVILDTKPIIDNNRTMVPLRGIFEKLGATVDYNKETKQVIVKTEDKEVLLEVGNDKILVNGRLSGLDVPSKVIDGRTLVPVRFVAEALGHQVGWDGLNRRVLIEEEKTVGTTTTNDLPKVGSYEHLAQLLRYSSQLGSYIKGFRTVDGIVLEDFIPDGEVAPTMENSEARDDAATESESFDSSKSESASQEESSGTNVQEEGVDEGDILKTDGNYIYYLKGNEVLVIDKNPEAPEILQRIPVSTTRGNIRDLYLSDNQLVIIGSSYAYYGYPEALREDGAFASTYNTGNTSLLVYDMSDVKNPVLVKDMDFEGYYQTSRLVAGQLYMVANRSMDYYTIQEWLIEEGAFDGNIIKERLEYEITPKYADNISGEITTIDIENVGYFPDYVQANYLMTIGVDLGGDKVDVDAYLGQAETVYATAEDLFIGMTHYDYSKQHNTLLYVPEYQINTSLYRFGLSKGDVEYKTKGKVEGAMLNQFSLGYYDNHLRVATTSGQAWQADGQSSNVFILDDSMAVVGQVNDIAPGERIYSTRFYEDRIYMVTFRQVDPFYVIDASVPSNPEILGYLKVPGFSTYMHLLDKNHILGFGKETTEEDGRVLTGGFKISLFDVTDANNPVEKKKEVIGTTGTYSELDYNHKALMISLTKGVMGFPVSVASQTPYSIEFEGGYVYSISTDDFTYRGQLSHKGARVKRLAYIGDYIYGISDAMMSVHHMDTIEKVGQVDFSVTK